MACDNNLNSITRTIIIATGRNANEDTTIGECLKPVTNSALLKKILTILVRTTLRTSPEFM
jgi:hypothetical protein